MRQRLSAHATLINKTLDKLAWTGRTVFADSFFKRLFGMKLPGLHPEDGPVILVFPRCRSVHTFGMHQALDIAFVSKEGQLLAIHNNVWPNRALCNKKAFYVLERVASE